MIQCCRIGEEIHVESPFFHDQRQQFLVYHLKYGKYLVLTEFAAAENILPDDEKRLLTHHFMVVCQAFQQHAQHRLFSRFIHFFRFFLARPVSGIIS